MTLQQIPKGLPTPGLKFEKRGWQLQEIEQRGGVITVRKSSAVGKSQILYDISQPGAPRPLPKPLVLAVRQAWAPKSLPKGNPKV